MLSRWKGQPSDDPPEPAYPPVDTEGFEIRAFDHDVGEIAVFRLEQPAARGALDALDEQLLPEAHEEDVPVPQLLDGLIDEDGVLMADHRLHAVPDDVQHDGFLGVDAHPAQEVVAEGIHPQNLVRSDERRSGQP